MLRKLATILLLITLKSVNNSIDVVNNAIKTVDNYQLNGIIKLVDS